MFSALSGPFGPTLGAPNSAGGSPPVITSPSSLVVGTVGTIYPTTTFTATGTAPITWTVQSGTLPTGMSFSSGGVLSGTPTATASGSITFRATNAFGFADRPLTLTINAVVANQIVVNNASASTLSNYPIQIGRPFVQGAIPSGQSPVFSDGGTTLSTQSDVKTRWPDGSVKFAIMSAIVPSLSATTRKTLSIGTGTPASGSAPTVSQFLSDNPNFDISLQFTGGVSATVSARTMMAAGAVTSWCSGPVMTSWVVADHITKTYDVGSDANKSLRPIFHIQKWAGLDLYRVRVITEISDTTKLQPQTYAVRVTSGVSSPVELLQTASFTHLLASRWTKEFWIGSAAPASVVGIGHGVAYLAGTKAIPNYDPSITLSGSTVSSFLSSWSAAAKGPFEAGLWQKAMPSAGGRPDIGIFPSWYVWMLYSDNPDLQQAVRLQSDLAGAWMMNWRSGDTRTFDDVTGAAGKGLPVTRDSHPTQFIYQGNGYLNTYYVSAGDQFTFIGSALSPLVDNGWVHDGAHQPDPWYLTYLMTGDFWYLEQLQFWASSLLFYPNPGFSSSPKDAVINDTQLRARAWILRTRVRAAWASPDSTPEKAYFTRVTEQALRAMEGEVIGPGGSSSLRAFWAAYHPRPINALHYFLDGFSGSGYELGIPKSASLFTSSDNIWMVGMMVQSLGHATELGFGSQELLSFAAQNLITLATTPGVDPRHIADYRVPYNKTPISLFQTWTDVFDGYDYTGWIWKWDEDLGDLDHGYSIFATSAMSFIKNEPDGTAAWAWANTNGYQVANWAANPKMATIPRS